MAKDCHIGRDVQASLSQLDVVGSIWSNLLLSDHSQHPLVDTQLVSCPHIEAADIYGYTLPSWLQDATWNTKSLWTSSCIGWALEILSLLQVVASERRS
jgi:hypothetical protein